MGENIQDSDFRLNKKLITTNTETSFIKKIENDVSIQYLPLKTLQNQNNNTEELLSQQEILSLDESGVINIGQEFPKPQNSISLSQQHQINKNKQFFKTVQLKKKKLTLQDSNGLQEDKDSFIQQNQNTYSQISENSKITTPKNEFQNNDNKNNEFQNKEIENNKIKISDLEKYESDNYNEQIKSEFSDNDDIQNHFQKQFQGHSYNQKLKENLQNNNSANNNLESQQINIFHNNRYEKNNFKMYDESLQNSVRYQPRIYNCHTARSKSVKQIFQKLQNPQQNTFNQKWMHPSYQILVSSSVQIFIQRLKNQAGTWNNYIFNKKSYQYLNDLTIIKFGNQLKKNKNMMNKSQQQNINQIKMKQFVKQMYICWESLKVLPVLNPTSPFFYLWDLILTVATLFCIYYIPVQWVTGTNFNEIYGKRWKDAILTILIVFVLDIIIKFNVGYYEKGIRVMKRQKIFKRYLKKGIWSDILSFLPLINVLLDKNDTLFAILNALIVFKILDIYQILNKYNEILIIKRNRLLPALIKLTRLFIMVIFGAHILGCVWILIAKVELDLDKPLNDWMSKYDDTIIDSDWSVKYIYGFYWAVTTMTSVGYGDITPANEYETIICTFLMFIACFIFAYCFNLIGQIVEDLNQDEKLFVEQMRHVQRYFAEKEISEDLQTEVKKYLEYRHLAQNQLSVKETQKILNNIPDGLTEKLVKQANLPYLLGQDYLKHNFSLEFLEILSLNMEEDQYINNQIIIENVNKHDQQIIQDVNNYMYFIISGQIQISKPLKNKNKLTAYQNSYGLVLEHMDSFGQYSFFHPQNKHTYEIKSLGSTHVLKLNKKKFLELIEDFEDDKQIYCYLQDRILNEKIHHIFENECHNCYRKGHDIFHCPKLHFNPDVERAILINNFPQGHNRSHQYRRQEMRSWDSLMFLQDIQDIVEDFLMDLSQQEYDQLIQSMGENYNRITSLFQEMYENQQIESVIGNRVSNTNIIPIDQINQQMMEHQRIAKQRLNTFNFNNKQDKLKKGSSLNTSPVDKQSFFDKDYKKFNTNLQTLVEESQFENSNFSQNDLNSSSKNNISEGKKIRFTQIFDNYARQKSINRKSFNRLSIIQKNFLNKTNQNRSKEFQNSKGSIFFSNNTNNTINNITSNSSSNPPLIQDFLKIDNSNLQDKSPKQFQRTSIEQDIFKNSNFLSQQNKRQSKKDVTKFNEMSFDKIQSQIEIYKEEKQFLKVDIDEIYMKGFQYYYNKQNVNNIIEKHQKCKNRPPRNKFYHLFYLPSNFGYSTKYKVQGQQQNVVFKSEEERKKMKEEKRKKIFQLSKMKYSINQTNKSKRSILSLSLQEKRSLVFLNQK